MLRRLCLLTLVPLALLGAGCHCHHKCWHRDHHWGGKYRRCHCGHVETSCSSPCPSCHEPAVAAPVHGPMPVAAPGPVITPMPPAGDPVLGPAAGTIPLRPMPNAVGQK